MLISNRSTDRLNRRGVALPLALLGLVAVSLMVTTALITSSTQSAISGAQQLASKNIYEADMALEGYLGSLANSGQQTPLVPTYTSFTTATGRTFNISVAELRESPNIVVSDPGVKPIRMQDSTTFSLLATPQNVGRSAGALYTVVKTWSLGELNINSAGSVAANLLRIPGNSGAMSGVDQSGCTDINNGRSGSTGALTVSDSVRLELDTSRVLESGAGYANVTRDTLNRVQFALQILGGLTPEQLAETATIRWGEDLPGPGGTLVDGENISGLSGIRPGPENRRDSKLNWGCPALEAKLESRAIELSACSRTSSEAPQPSMQKDTAYYPVVAVRSPGNNFKIQGYGQGVLIVFGDVDLRDLNFFGVVIVTGDVQLNGTGYIGGAFIALGDATLGVENQEADSEEVEWNGRTFVRFNRCGLNMAQMALAQQNELNAAQTFATSSYSWFEVIR
jgi:hypothetical protein